VHDPEAFFASHFSRLAILQYFFKPNKVMNLRNSNIKRLQDEDTVFDVLVLGGGVNGAVSAASLSAKGAKVALIDKGDFAGLTSSNSSNLAWGGIKYLESHEYFLVNNLCKSRNHLMRSYPSTVKEIRFLTTIEKGFRFPSWFVYLGTIFYWIIGRFFTQAPDYISADKIKTREPATRPVDLNTPMRIYTTMMRALFLISFDPV